MAISGIYCLIVALTGYPRAKKKKKKRGAKGDIQVDVAYLFRHAGVVQSSTRLKKKKGVKT